MDILIQSQNTALLSFVLCPCAIRYRLCQQRLAFLSQHEIEHSMNTAGHKLKISHYPVHRPHTLVKLTQTKQSDILTTVVAPLTLLTPSLIRVG